MVDSPMFESIGDKAIVTPEFIGVDETSPFSFRDRQFQGGLTLDIGHNLHGYLQPSFRDAEYRHLSCRSPSTFSISPPAEI